MKFYDWVKPSLQFPAYLYVPVLGLEVFILLKVRFDLNKIWDAVEESSETGKGAQRANQSLAKQIKNFFEFVLFLKYYLLLIIYKCSNRSNFLKHKNCRYIFSMLNEIAWEIFNKLTLEWNIRKLEQGNGKVCMTVKK